MFHENDIMITMKEMQDLFKAVDADKSGELNLSEFKQFVLNKKAEEKFYDIIR